MANGRVFIVNPAGIVFGAGSTVNVTQLVASGLNMSNDAFNAVLADAGNLMMFEGGAGDVVNYGAINAKSVYLIGKNVANFGAIIAPNGLIVLAAGDNVYLAQDGSNVVVDVSDAGDGVTDVRNSGQITAENGSIKLAGGDTFSRAIVNTGTITVDGGAIGLRAARVENLGVIGADGFQGGDGGSVTLSGVEEVVLSGNSPTVTADGGANGDGGSITLESPEGSVDLGPDSIVSAAGGSASGDGGYIKITAEHFSIDPSGDVDASPQNMDYAAGTLEIDPPTVTIANGASLGAVDTIYEEDIETLSNNGTNVIIQADNSIIVQDIADDVIEGRFGDIELHATGAAGSVSFVDKDDTISTTLGDIVISAGSGGINIGSLETAKDLPSQKPPSGQITLTTSNGGDITAKNLAVKTGWGRGEIAVDASGDLTINGDVAVGRDNSILNVPNGANAEAIISLSAGDNVVLNGDVTANTHGINSANPDGVTESYIGIFGGTDGVGDGDVTINGDLVAKAKSASNGTTHATIDVSALGDIIFGPDAAMPLADGDNGKVRVESFESAEETNDAGDVARIIIDAQMTQPPTEPPDTDPPDTDPPDTTPPSSETAPPPAPGVDERRIPKISGYPALTKWVAEEIGVDERLLAIWFAHAPASARDIPPYSAYSRFKKAAIVLRTHSGIHANVLMQMISEFASSATPLTEERMASIADAIEHATGTGGVDTLTESYIDSVVEYVTFMVYEMDFSEEDAVEFVRAKYIDKLPEMENTHLAASLTERLATLYLEERP